MKKYKELKIGIIGCGYWATNIIKTLEKLNIKNISTFDKDTSKVNLIKKKFPFTKNIKSLNDLIRLDLDCFFFNYTS